MEKNINMFQELHMLIMVHIIDFSASLGKLHNSTITSDILIEMNTEKEEIPRELADEGPESYSVYTRKHSF